MTVANIQLAYANGKLSLAQAKRAVAETYLAECQAVNVNVDTKLKESQLKTADALADTLIESQKYDFELYKQNNPLLSGDGASWIDDALKGWVKYGGAVTQPVKGIFGVSTRFGK